MVLWMWMRRSLALPLTDTHRIKPTIHAQPHTKTKPHRRTSTCATGSSRRRWASSRRFSPRHSAPSSCCGSRGAWGVCSGVCGWWGRMDGWEWMDRPPTLQTPNCSVGMDGRMNRHRPPPNPTLNPKVPPTPQLPTNQQERGAYRLPHPRFRQGDLRHGNHPHPAPAPAPAGAHRRFCGR